MVSERSYSNGPRVSKSRRSDWTSCLTYLESTFSLLGYLGVDIFVNKTLNSHVGPTEIAIARGLFVRRTVSLGILVTMRMI